MVTPPRGATYEDIKVFDDLHDYITYYRNENSGKDFTRIGFQDWKGVEIDGNNYYHHWYEDNYLTEEAYKKLLKECEKTYHIQASSLIKSPRDGVEYISGNKPSVEAVIDYMKSEKSWLHQVFKEIDQEISDLQKKIDKLNKIKSTLNDEEYLKSKIKTEYTFDSKKYFEAK